MANLTYDLSKKHFFVNPYNFVPADLNKTERSDATNVEGPRMTGYLACGIKCRTPLAIPDVAAKDDTEVKDHFQYPFIGAADGTPRIPGSSIRGVVRSVYETITDSCFGTMKKDTVITVRSKEAFEPGLLIQEDGEWRLYKAIRHRLPLGECTRLTVEDSGERVDFQTQDSGKDIVTIVKPGTGTAGYLCIGEQAPKRKYHGIFEKQAMVAQYPVLEAADFEKLESTLQVYRNSKINKTYPEKHKGYPAYDKAKKNGVIPVYYQIQEGRPYLSFAALGRKAFYKTLNERAGEKAHQKCGSRDNLCPACALFGTLEGEGLGSRVRFTDAYCRDFEPSRLKKNVTFAELASPRPSYVPFYLRELEQGANYQVGYDSDVLQIRGRKFYWHHVPDTKTAVKKDSLNGSFDVFLPEAQKEGEATKPDFTFRLYFDGISEEQLKWLASAVHLYENDMDGTRCHKMGHGKPLGYGSVKMTVDQCVVRSFDLESGWNESKKPVEDLCDPTCYRCDEETLNAFIAICDFDMFTQAGNLKVEYPDIVTEGLDPAVRRDLKKNDTAGHQWFTKNYPLGARRPVQDFPEIVDDAETLKLAKYQLRTEPPKQAGHPRQTGGQEYQAVVISSGQSGSNENYLIYEIQIVDNEHYGNRDCTMSAHRTSSFQIGQKVKVKRYKGTRFNCIEQRKRGK